MAKLIIEKEKTFGNQRATHLSMQAFYDGRPDRYTSERHQESLLRKLKDELREGICNFYVVEIEGTSISTFRRFHQCASTFGRVSGYLIELQQRLDICMRYAKPRRMESDVREAIDEINKEPPPTNVTLVDPGSIFRKNPKLDKITQIMQKSVALRNYSTEMHKVDFKMDTVTNPLANLKPEDTVDMASQFTQLLNDPEVMQLIHDSFVDLSINGSQSDTSTLMTNISDCPTFRPKRFYDHNHKHKQRNYEDIYGFHARKIIDYDHRPSLKLNQFIDDVDTDSVMTRSRASAIRSKILWYLKRADKPEDTFSNAEYPNNWQILSPLHIPKTERKRKKLSKIEKEKCLDLKRLKIVEDRKLEKFNEFEQQSQEMFEKNCFKSEKYEENVLLKDLTHNEII